MTDETHVDGNALGGMLLEVFGREMTDAHGACATCGAVHPVGAMRVYRGSGRRRALPDLRQRRGRGGHDP